MCMEAKIVNAFLKKVKGFVGQNRMFDKRNAYLVALSGGADSVALLRTMVALGYNVHAAHCNFHLRGDEADRDENFCVMLCDELNVTLHRAHFDTRAYASLHHVSIEMAARTLRYDYFRTLCRDLQLCGICVAHHRDDSVETVLLNLVRGTGVSGLRGILPVNGDVYRPLLCVDREQITDYLDALSQDYVTDSTNLVPDVMRNKLRLQVLPLLKTLNPDVCNAISRTAVHVTEAAKILDASVAHDIQQACCCNDSVHQGNGLRYNVAALLKSASPEYVLFGILGKYGFTTDQIHDVCKAMTGINGEGARVWESKSHATLLSRGCIMIEPIDTALRYADMLLKMPEPGIYVFGTPEKHLRLSLLDKTEDFAVSKKRNLACVDAARLVYPLTLRRWRNGDRFVPFGMKCKKLVSDFLTDIKKNLFEKRSQLVVENGNGEIVWVVNERVDNRYRVSDNTAKIAKMIIE